MKTKLLKKATGGSTTGSGTGDPSPNYTKTSDPKVYMGKYGIPITYDDFLRNQKSDLPFTSFEAFADWLGGWAHKPGDITTVKPQEQPVRPPDLSDKARGYSNVYYNPNSIPVNKSPDTIHSTSGYYANGGPINPDDLLTPSDYAILNQYVNPQAANRQAGLDPMLRQVTEQGADTSIPKPTNTPRQSMAADQIDYYANLGSHALDLMQSVLDRREDNKVNNRIKDRMTSDVAFAATPSDGAGNRGNYDENTGIFRPDAMGAQSPYGMTNSYYKKGGELPKAMYGTGIIPDMTNIHDVFSGGDITPPPSFNIPTMGQPQTTPDFHSFTPVPKTVAANDTARTAYNYYVDKHNLPTQVAAGIVGNLMQESSLKTGAVEKGNTGNGRGIAQWDARDRWPAFLNWAKSTGRDPNDLHTQLDYVLVEPGWGQKALKQTMQAQTPQDATMIFGRAFERPNEKQAAWGTRIGYAQSLSKQYEVGGEYTVSDEDLKTILANGGQVEYL